MPGYDQQWRAGSLCCQYQGPLSPLSFSVSELSKSYKQISFFCLSHWEHLVQWPRQKALFATAPTYSYNFKRKNTAFLHETHPRCTSLLRSSVNGECKEKARFTCGKSCAQQNMPPSHAATGRSEQPSGTPAADCLTKSGRHRTVAVWQYSASVTVQSSVSFLMPGMTPTVEMFSLARALAWHHDTQAVATGPPVGHAKEFLCIENPKGIEYLGVAKRLALGSA